ncbi:MAG TPA: branched-chain amino acid ABC transporter permease [Candidatus Limnocylindria bacterium]|nr:branched-chain amino acid ABC transporter permease [Candidatus Limnocylindria bacterium]
MSLELVVQQALNGISFGALLFILAAGLSLIFGMMDVVNLAHGAFYMLGAYVAYQVVQVTGQFWLAILVAPVALAGLGLVVEPLLLRRLRGKHLDQVLLTIGVGFVIVDLIGLYWGREVRTLPFPPGFDRSIDIGGSAYPTYRLFVIAFAVLLAGILYWLHRRSAIGALIRAGVDDAQMLSALGVDTDRLFAITFAVGAGLAGLAGVVAAPAFGIQPGMDVDALIFSLIVVVVGGLGTLNGAAVGAALVGPAETFGKVLFPQFALALIFAIMAVILLGRPSGLFGRIRIGR